MTTAFVSMEYEKFVFNRRLMLILYRFINYAKEKRNNKENSRLLNSTIY